MKAQAIDVANIGLKAQVAFILLEVALEQAMTWRQECLVFANLAQSKNRPSLSLSILVLPSIVFYAAEPVLRVPDFL